MHAPEVTGINFKRGLLGYFKEILWKVETENICLPHDVPIHMISEMGLALCSDSGA